MATITFENVRNVKPYYDWDPRVILGVNAVPNHSYSAKANTIRSILESSSLIPEFVDDPDYWGKNAPHEVRVRLHTVRETAISKMRVNNFCFGTISQVCYANHKHEVGKQPYQTVHIEMDSWYFENYPLGYCTGMLCHEFAVHPLGDYTLRKFYPSAEKDENDYTSGSKKNLEYGFKYQPKVKPSAAGQSDHAFAAYPECRRYKVYQNTILDAALAMESKIGKAPKGDEVAVTQSDVTDLFKCYLMDVASIQATNDHRAKGATKPKVLADCYNAHRNLLLQLVADDGDPRKALIPGPTTTGAVIKDFVYLLSSLAWSLGPNWSKSWSGY
jgi:hypothetical protein